MTSAARLLASRLAVACEIHVRVDEAAIATIAVAHSNPEKDKTLESLNREYAPTIGDQRGSGFVIATGRREIIENEIDCLHAVAVDDRQIHLLREIGFESRAIVPLKSGERIIGAVSVYLKDCSPRSLMKHVDRLQEMAWRMALVLENCQMYRGLEDANRAKSDFLANVSHEMRTPLTAILGYTDLIKTPSENGRDLAKNIDTIRRNGKQLLALIDDLLDSAKVEAGQLTIEKLRFDPKASIKEVILSLQPLARSKNLKFRAAFSDDLPTTIFSDPTRLKQMLQNLLSNAIKFTSSGSIGVDVSMKPASNGHQVSIKVSDTGVGLSDLQKARIFHPFAQADASTTRRFGGTGLGLVLSRSLARALGGDVVLVESLEGRGSVFEIAIDPGPVDENVIGEKAKVVSAKSDDIANLSAVTNSFGDLENTRILLAEDSPDLQMLVSCLLKKAGAHVEVADNGKEAIAKVNTDAFDLVLMDVQMPICDGYEATRQLRSQGHQKPIIALSAHARTEDRNRSLIAGCDAHLTKPIDIDQLISTIQNHVERFRNQTN